MPVRKATLLVNLRPARRRLPRSSPPRAGSETPCVARAYCPRCEPEADPIGEVLNVRWCEAHAPARDGLDDHAVSHGASPSLTIEAGGADNRQWCDLLHREGGGVG